MFQVEHCHHCTIIPPYMLQKIADNGDLRIKDVALRQLQRHQELRARRHNLRPLNGSSSTIKVYDAKNNTELPGTLVSDPATSKDQDVVNVYKWAKKTDEFYHTFFSRKSIDNNGMPIISTINYDVNYENAFWDGAQMVYGDGDGKYFASFTTDSDIFAHEFTHGVTQYDVNLAYENQSGALNESISDVFGIMAKQYIQNETVDQSNWLIGEKLLIGDHYALRSLKSPGTAYLNHPVFGDDPQPGSMDAYDNTTGDNGGVHINSGIPNRAFYLASTKLREYDSAQFSSSWNGTGKIWYQARIGLPEVTTFSEFASKTVNVAAEIFGKDSYAEKATRYAWAEVKVTLDGSGGGGGGKKNPCCSLV